MVAKLINAVKPLQLVSKVNEIIDSLEGSYTGYNPVLSATQGVCTWIVTHNLETENVNYTLYKNNTEVLASVEITSENAITIKLNSEVDIPAETFKVVILADGGAGSGSGGDITIDSTLSSTSTNPVQNKVIYEAIGNVEAALAAINSGV